MVNEFVNKIRDVLSKSKKIDYAFLFGSAARKPLPDSDVDILLGACLEYSEKIDLAMELELVLKRRVDVVLANEAPCELVLKALSQGVPVLINNKQSLKKDYFRNIYQYEDRRNLRQLRVLKIKKKYNYG